jgi:ribosomal protein S18 acetylase RimI-like enzyme
MELQYRLGTVDDLNIVNWLEQNSYPFDEAATFSKLQFRMENAGEFFLVVVRDYLIGFVCASLSTSLTLTHDSMSTHDPIGDHLLIHSVVVDPNLRRKGIGLDMLRHYLQHVKTHSPFVKRVSLMSKPNHITFYEKAGFTLIGPSPVPHGQELWYELTTTL